MVREHEHLTSVLVAAIMLVATCGGLGAAPLNTELIHPQSDDQGHYIAFGQHIRATIFGAVSPAEGVASVEVNGKRAQVLPGELPPFGADSAADTAEFRATVELTPSAPIIVRIDGSDGEVTKVTFEPDTEAVTSRLRARVQERPDASRDRCRLGAALRDQGHLEEAIVELRKSLEENSACVNTRVVLGKALVEVGRPEEALQEFTLATEAAPDYPMGWLELGLVHARFTRNVQEAVRAFKRYLELEPDSSIADKVRRYIESHP